MSAKLAEFAHLRGDVPDDRIAEMADVDVEAVQAYWAALDAATATADDTDTDPDGEDDDEPETGAEPALEPASPEAPSADQDGDASGQADTDADADEDDTPTDTPSGAASAEAEPAPDDDSDLVRERAVEFVLNQVLDGTIADLTRDLETGQFDLFLGRLWMREQAGKARKGAVAAIEARRAALLERAAPSPPSEELARVAPAPEVEPPRKVKAPHAVRLLKSQIIKDTDGRTWRLQFRDVYSGKRAAWLWEHHPDLVERFPPATA